MDSNPFLQSLPALAIFGLTMWGLMKVHERSLAKILAKNEEERIDNLVLRAEVASLRRLVLNGQTVKTVHNADQEALPLKIKVV